MCCWRVLRAGRIFVRCSLVRQVLFYEKLRFWSWVVCYFNSSLSVLPTFYPSTRCPPLFRPLHSSNVHSASYTRSTSHSSSPPFSPSSPLPTFKNTHILTLLLPPLPHPVSLTRNEHLPPRLPRPTPNPNARHGHLRLHPHRNPRPSGRGGRIGV